MKMETFPVSVVIPTLNEEIHLPLLLDSLLQSEWPFEAIVVDGNSTDGTRRIIEEYRPRFTGSYSLRSLLSEKQHVGSQRNLGGKSAQYETLIFLDADVILPEKDTLRRLITEFTERALVAANPKLTWHPNENTFFVRWLFRFLRTFQKCMLLFGKPYFAGACIITRRKVFMLVNGFDETIPLAEDVDYAFRVRAYGHCGILSAPVSTSMRRLEKIGLREFWEYTKALPVYFITGKVPEKMMPYYTFGDH